MRLTLIVVTVAFIALIGAQPAAAQTPAPGGADAKAAQTGGPQAPLARAVNLDRRASGRALVAGYANFRGAQVLLQYWRNGWVGWTTTTSNRYGYYGFWVPAGYFYRFYVQTRINIPYYFGPQIGWLSCGQTWADFSRSVRPRRGWRYRNMNTHLQPVGRMDC